MDIQAVLAITLLFGGGTLVGVMYSPVGAAIAERIRRKGGIPDDSHGEIDAVREELADVRAQLSELAERQDFAERVLAQHREKGALSAGQGE